MHAFSKDAEPALKSAAANTVLHSQQCHSKISEHLRLCLLQSLEAIEEQLLPLRKELHQLLGLPLDRPMLRMANAMTFDDSACEGLLLAQMCSLHRMKIVS